MESKSSRFAETDRKVLPSEQTLNIMLHALCDHLVQRGWLNAAQWRLKTVSDSHMLQENHNFPVSKTPAITCLNDYRPVALTSTAMKCLERLGKTHICSSLPATMDPHQFAYRSNRSTDDAIALTVHCALTHLDRKNSYVRMLFIDYSSAFNTIIPAKLIPKLTDLGLNSHLFNWVLDFQIGIPQVVRVGNSFSSTLTLSTGAPQGCVLSPLLYSLFTHDCVARHTSNIIFKFADDTTILGLITDGDETAYRDKVSALSEWCYHNNLSLNISASSSCEGSGSLICLLTSSPTSTDAL
ncbi:hypothetical protein NFI96_002282 [Prochilodus magdalenae]|nr:hypothetical protein NFI96_002282 [Prochilodus magdalenae]